MQDFQAGDATALEVLYERYRTPIYSFLARQCAVPATAAELTQEVFLRVIRSATSFRHGSRFSTWLFAIARNLAVDTARRKKYRDHVSLDDTLGQDGPRLGERLAGNDPGPERASTAVRLRGDIEMAISRLPAEQREVFLLREYHGLAFEEIAAVVDAKVGTVKSRMRYALESLRRELADYMDYARTLS